MEQKRAFLKKKGDVDQALHWTSVELVISAAASLVGMTDAEIDAAIRLAPATPSSQAVSMGIPNQIAIPPLPPRPPPPRSRSWSEIAVVATVVGGVGFAVVRFIRVSNVCKVE